jgi:uncharacterized RDD family membrane protein YckC
VWRPPGRPAPPDPFEDDEDEDVAELASFWRRAGATALDSAILQVTLALLAVVLGGASIGTVLSDPSGTVVDEWLLLQLGLWATYVPIGLLAVYTVPLLARGRTLGMMVTGVVAVHAGDHGPPGFLRSFVRWLLPPGLLGLVTAAPPVMTSESFGTIAFACFIGAVVIDDVWMLWDPRAQTLHDKVAGTLVLRAERSG